MGRQSGAPCGRVARRRLAAGGLLLLLGAAGCLGERPMTRKEMHGYLSEGIEGFWVTATDRDRLLRHPEAVRYYAALLGGRVPAPPYWDRSMAVYWLAESGDPRYVPIFLRFAAPDLAGSGLNEAGQATYGLARHAWHSPAARRRLRALGRPGVRWEASANLAITLAMVNDDTTRALLRALPGELVQPVRDHVEAALARPARPFGARRPLGGDACAALLEGSGGDLRTGGACLLQKLAR